MPEQFIGAEVRAGNFTNDKGEIVHFNNLMMTFVKPSNVGVMVNDKKPLVKVKNTREDIFRVFGEMITMKWLNDRLGWFCDVFYDDKNKVARIMFYGPDNPLDGGSPLSPAIPSANEGVSDYDRSSPSDDNGAILAEQLNQPSDKMPGFPSETSASGFPATSDTPLPSEASAPAEVPSDNKKGGKR